MLPRWSRRAFDCFRVVSGNVTLVRWNHYRALGLTPSASLSDIKSAYYKLSKLHHPDRNNGSQASAKKFRDIVAAYEVLSKADSRRKYDREINKSFDPSEFLPRKKAIKRNKKNSSSSKIKASQFKNDIRTKSKYRSPSKFSKNMTRNQSGEFETFLVRAIPFVVACLLCCKKR